MRRPTFWMVLSFCGVLLAYRVLAQADCGTADRLDFPIDRSQFTLVQTFGAESSRHQGRYHTGEDWYGGRDASVLQPIKAIANGRVTFANPTAWGRDGGVVIIEHTFTDGSVVYSMYGHITDAGAPFPERLTCVGIGQIIGAIADVRPAPHLHFEIRTENPDIAGAGYTREFPTTFGNLAPSEYIINQQAYLRPSHAWHVAVRGGVQFAPFILNDNSLLYVDGENTLRRLLPDGRIYWRQKSDKTIVAVTAFLGNSVVTFADGTFQTINVEDGTLGEEWRVPNFEPIGSPLALGDWLIFPSKGNELIAMDETRRQIVWRVADVPPFLRAYVANEGVNAVIGLVTVDNTLVQIAGSGVILSRTPLRYRADLAQMENGDLLAYTWGGLWQIGVDGTWRELFDVPHGGDVGAVWRNNGLTTVYDGQRLTAFGREELQLWQVPLVATGTSTLVQFDTYTALVSQSGAIAVVSAAGQLCNQVDVFNSRHIAVPWQALGDDGILRVAIGEQIIGIDWQRFLQDC